MYAEFRPSVDGWGGRGEVRCDKILALRKKGVQVPVEMKHSEASESVHVGGGGQSISATSILKIENAYQTGSDETDNPLEQEEPDRKKSRGLSLEEYEAALDHDTSFDEVDLNFSGTGVSFDMTN